MKTLRGVADEMTWTATRKRSYELRAGDDVMATLRWPDGFGSPAQGETADGRFVIERSGLLRPRLFVREDESATIETPDAPAASQRPPILTLALDFGGNGVAQTRAGKKYEWAPTNLWRTSWAFEADGKPVVTFQTDSGVTFAHKAKVNAGAGVAELVTLVLLGSAVGVYLTEDVALFGT